MLRQVASPANSHPGGTIQPLYGGESFLASRDQQESPVPRDHEHLWTVEETFFFLQPLRIRFASAQTYSPGKVCWAMGQAVARDSPVRESDRGFVFGAEVRVPKTPAATPPQIT